MVQQVNTFTRITARSKSAIDHAITNINKLETMVTHMAISDHQIVISYLGNKQGINKQTKNKLVQTRVDITETSTKIKQINWTPWMEECKDLDTNQTYDRFHEKIQSCITYLKPRAHKRKSNQPFNNEELKSIRENFKKSEQNF